MSLDDLPLACARVLACQHADATEATAITLAALTACRDELPRLQMELQNARRRVEGLCQRVAEQSDQLSRNAEKSGVLPGKVMEAIRQADEHHASCDLCQDDEYGNGGYCSIWLQFWHRVGIAHLTAKGGYDAAGKR